MLATITMPSYLTALIVLKYGKQLLNIICIPFGSGWLLYDIIECGDTWRIPLPPAKRSDVFTKKVVQLQIVERPMGHCGRKVTVLKTPPLNLGHNVNKYTSVYELSKLYDKGTIKCLHCLGVRTSMSGKTDRVMHSGIVVKTEDGNKYLIHKGRKFGTSYQRTIIEVANDGMYDRGYEKVGDPIAPKNTARTVEEYFRKSGGSYDFMHNNCHDATLRMKDLANKS